MDTAVRSIVYIWWRKSKADNYIIKFGDHTEPLANNNWYKDTETYIQQTAAPREKKTFKDLIQYKIIDVTDYAKSVNRNYKFAKIDNYIADILNFKRFRLGQTDQFKLNRFEIDRDEFIEAIENLTTVQHLTCNADLNTLFDQRQYQFTADDPVTEILTAAQLYSAHKVLIKVTDVATVYSEIKSHKLCGSYHVYKDNIKDGRFNFMDAIMIVADIESEDSYDMIVTIDNSHVDLKLNSSDFKKLDLFRKEAQDLSIL